MKKAGYKGYYQLLNAYDYGIVQTRQRVFFVGVRKDIKTLFQFPLPTPERKTLKDTIRDLKDTPIKPLGTMKTNVNNRIVPNHEYSLEKCSKYFICSNRVRNWDEPSYTIVASSNSNPLHPQALTMTKIKRGEYQFAT